MLLKKDWVSGRRRRARRRLWPRLEMNKERRLKGGLGAERCGGGEKWRQGRVPGQNKNPRDSR